MTTDEMQRIIESWDKHMTKNGRKHEIECYSSIREEEFRDTFRNGILNHPKLSKKEKAELIAYTGLPA